MSATSVFAFALLGGFIRRIFRKAWFEFFPMALHFGAEQGGFGDFVADVLSATKSPASALPAPRAPSFFMQGYRLGIITATLRFESPSGTAIFQKTSEEIRKTLFFLFLLNKKMR